MSINCSIVRAEGDMEICASAGLRLCVKVVRNDPGDLSPGDFLPGQKSLELKLCHGECFGAINIMLLSELS